MGDRANIVVRDRWTKDAAAGEAVFLYSHWGGHELPEVLRVALARCARWDDESYLARIIFDAMLEGQHDWETGYGISTRLRDNEYDLLVLSHQRVYSVSEMRYRDEGFGSLAECSSISFEEYIEAPERTWENLLEVAVHGSTD